MKPIDRIRVNDCLQFREAAFVDIYESEKLIEEILGGANFPLSAPGIDLPSTFRPEKAKAKRNRRKSAVIRTLKKGSENAYRITFLENGKEGIRLIRSVQFIRQLMRSELSLFQVTRVETVFCQSEEDIQLIEVLYDAKVSGDI